jgi:hypothetical protein
MSTIEVLDDIPVTLNADDVMKVLGIPARDESIERMVREMVETALPIARPKAVYVVSRVDNRSEDSLDIDGIRFSSRILSVNLEKTNRVFPYVATCGRELDEITLPEGDLIASYCLDAIKMVVLGAAFAHLNGRLTDRYRLGEISFMSPGSLESWPLTQQKELFSILGDVEGAIGVTLTESLLMMPTKSTSGIFFPTETGFENCQLCPMEKCVGRRAPYDPALVEQYERTASRRKES